MTIRLIHSLLVTLPGVTSTIDLFDKICIIFKQGKFDRSACTRTPPGDEAKPNTDVTRSQTKVLAE